MTKQEYDYLVDTMTKYHERLHQKHVTKDGSRKAWEEFGKRRQKLEQWYAQLENVWSTKRRE